MKSKATAGLYVLLIVLAALSMVYYIAGVLALREEFFHASRYARAPFDFRDDGQTSEIFAKKPQSPVYPMEIFSWQSTEFRSQAMLRLTTSCGTQIRAK